MKHPAEHPARDIWRRFPLIAIVLVELLLSGCVYALHVSSDPTDVRLKIQAPQPQDYTARVALEDLPDNPVAPDGTVSFTVPRFSHGCDVYVFGILKTRDGSAENVRVVELRRSGQVVRKLSLAQIAKLPVDTAGYRTIKP
jgi:hypothetical protein